MKHITFGCPHCQALQTLTLDDMADAELSFDCPECHHSLRLTRLQQQYIEGCPACGCKDLHQHKDFNKKIGVSLFVIGAIFAPWTYYISLVVALLIDAMLFPFFPWMAVCYRCHAEMRGWPKNPTLDRFNHEIAAHYEYRDEKKSL